MQRNPGTPDSSRQPSGALPPHHGATRGQPASAADSRRLVTGRVVQLEHGGPVAGARVEVDGHHARTDGQGVYCLPLEQRSAAATLRVSAPGFYTCIESIDLACVGSGGLLTRDVRLVSDGSTAAEAAPLVLERIPPAGSPSPFRPPPLEPLIDRLLAGPGAQAPVGSRRASGRLPSPDDFDTALDHELSSLFDTGLDHELSSLFDTGLDPERSSLFDAGLDPERSSLFDAGFDAEDAVSFDDEDGEELLYDDDLDDDERILFGADLDEPDDAMDFGIGSNH